MLELKDISYSVNGAVHIHPTTLKLEKSTINVLLGRTLAGKTTLMRLMSGLDKPTSGKILWDGQDVTGVRVQDRKIAMVYQQFINYPSMTVYENIASPMRLQGIAREEIDRAVRDTAEMLKLTPMLERKPLELSGGQQQRCALARALVKNAGLVLFDEPLANLDYKLREELRVEIPKIFEAAGSIFVYATTEPEEALLLGGNVATMHEGRITQFGPTAEVYRKPGDRVTARVFSDPPMNFITMRKSGAELHIGRKTFSAEGRFTGLADGEYEIGFRPNHLSLSRKSETDLDFDAKLHITEITGSETFVHVTYDDNRWIGVAHGVLSLETGQALPVYVNPDHAYVFSPEGPLVLGAAYASALGEAAHG